MPQWSRKIRRGYDQTRRRHADPSGTHQRARHRAGRRQELRHPLDAGGEPRRHVQHIILDGEDEFFTLHERFDYLLIGGDGPDVPLHEDTADRLATMLSKPAC